MPFHYSLKHSFTLNFLLVAAIPVLLFGLFSLHLISTYQHDGVRERNMAQARSIAAEVEVFLQSVRTDLLHIEQTISSETILHSASIDDFLSVAVRNSRFFESIYLLDGNFKVLNLGLLPELQSRRDDYTGLDLSGHQVFIKKDGVKVPTWSNTFVSLITGEPSVTLWIPMSNGFLMGNVSLGRLRDLLRREALHTRAEASIVDQNGTLIAHNISSMAMQRINFGDHPAVVAALRGTESTQEFKQGGRYSLESVALIPSTDWVVWVSLDMNQVLAPVHEMSRMLIAFMLVVIAMSGGIALIHARRFMKPLIELGQRTGMIADGRYDFHFHPSGLTEIDELANQVTSMAHAIHDREESIMTSEQRFRDLVNSIDGIVWEMEYPSFRFLFVSKQAEMMLGYPLDDWYEIESFWDKTVHAEDLGSARAYCQLMAEKQEDHDFEYRMIAADGRVVWIRDLVTVVVEGNRPVRLLGVMIDVTEQKVLLDELSRSEQNYREIFNSTSDAIFIHDADTGQILDVNQAMLDMFNCSYEEALRFDFEKGTLGESPYAVDGGKPKLREAKEKGSSSFEWRTRKATGEVIWTDVTLRSAVIGNYNRLIATVRDISERKYAAEKLREANERLLLLIERMPVGCIFWSPEITVDMWNPEAESIFGFNEEEMVGRSPYGTIISEKVRPEIEPVWSKLKAGDSSVHSVNENLTKAGQVIICEWHNTSVIDASGQIIGFISMTQDISDRKAAEDELESYRVHLEDLVKERTEQLETAQQALVQKEKLAVLGQLTTTVSHEIRNPLGTVANSIYLLKSALRGEEYAHLARPLTLAERNVDRCDSIISDLLDFSRQRKIEKEPLAIDEWLNELLSEMSFPVDVRCQWELSCGAIVPADSERLRRVLINVVTNALQALDGVPAVDRQLQIKTRVIENRCEIVVRDNGPGMNEDVMSRIFEPMFSTKNFGVGLGVPIIKNILEGHGGGVMYNSAPGKGTTVAMWLPLETVREG